MLPHRHDVELLWDEGGIAAPVELFVQHIILALTKEQQEQVLSAVIEEIERRNAAIQVLEEEEEFNGSGVS